MAKDKIYHFAVGVLIFAISSVLFDNLMLSLGIVALAGVAKEVYDKISGKGTCELLDFVATVAGGLVAYILLGGI